MTGPLTREGALTALCHALGVALNAQPGSLAQRVEVHRLALEDAARAAQVLATLDGGPGVVQALAFMTRQADARGVELYPAAQLSRPGRAGGEG